jgi:hypothetical protein
VRGRSHADSMMTKFLFKANDEVLSYCNCSGRPAMSSGQLDCPWCGCGWLITCSNCKKAFTFAEVRESDQSLFELGWAEARSRGLKNITDAEVAEWAEGMKDMLDCFEVGDIVVYLDGSYWTIDSEEIEFDGYFSHHKLDRLPHQEALINPHVLRSVLGDQNYWFDRELPDRSEN